VEHHIRPAALADTRLGPAPVVAPVVASRTHPAGLLAVVRIAAEEGRRTAVAAVRRTGARLRRIVAEGELHILAGLEEVERHLSRPECHSLSRCYRARA
jgi:hypothetical protein